MDLSNARQSYELGSIDIENMDPCPVKQFEIWFQEASDSGILEPNAMVLATVDGTGRPTQRTVLLKYFDKTGFVFFTNYKSRKATQIAKNNSVSLLFPWYQLQRQVEIGGQVEKVSQAESLKYFMQRPRGSQLGAWVSQQSSVVSNRSVLMNSLQKIKAQFLSGSIPMPPSWGGFRVKPGRIEFWQGGRDRLHDRIEYQSSDSGLTWNLQRLSP